MYLGTDLNWCYLPVDKKDTTTIQLKAESGKVQAPKYAPVGDILCIVVILILFTFSFFHILSWGGGIASGCAPNTLLQN